MVKIKSQNGVRTQLISLLVDLLLTVTGEFSSNRRIILLTLSKDVLQVADLFQSSFIFGALLTVPINKVRVRIKYNSVSTNACPKVLPVLKSLESVVSSHQKISSFGLIVWMSDCIMGITIVLVD